MNNTLLFAEFGHYSDTIIFFLGSFTLAFDATRIADLAKELDERILTIRKSLSH